MSSEEREIFNIHPTIKTSYGALSFLALGCVAGGVIGTIASPKSGMISAGVSFGAFVVIGLIILLWAKLKVWSTNYRLTTERFFVKEGLISRHVEEIELFRVKDVSYTQSVFGRLLGYGNVTMITTDDTTPTLTLRSVDNPEAIKEDLRKQYRERRQSEKGATEFIAS